MSVNFALREEIAKCLCKVDCDVASRLHGHDDPYTADEIWDQRADVIRDGYRQAAAAVLALPGMVSLLKVAEEAERLLVTRNSDYSRQVDRLIAAVDKSEYRRTSADRRDMWGGRV